MMESRHSLVDTDRGKQTKVFSCCCSTSGNLRLNRLLKGEGRGMSWEHVFQVKESTFDAFRGFLKALTVP